MIRRFGTSPEPSQSYRHRPGAYALLPRDGQLLLTCQTQPELDIQLPGGGIEIGEHPLHALHREVFEETGWKIAAPKKVGVFRRFVFMPEYEMWAEKVCHIYMARPALQISNPIEPHHEVVWVDADIALDALGNPGDRHFAEMVSRWT